ncbi:MAG: twin-arginine translocase subunit TatC [Planctomycetota bacterium]
MASNKDLFDDTAMTFGEHLEVLRFHLIRAMIGLAICVFLALLFGEGLVVLIRQPIDSALRRANIVAGVQDSVKGFDFWQSVSSAVYNMFMPPATPTAEQMQEAHPETTDLKRTITLELSAHELASQLHEAAPALYPVPPDELKDKTLALKAKSEAFSQFRTGIEKIDRPVTLNVQEAFVTYMKVSFIAGLVVASPWVFFQLWLFVAAGLYPHERKYIYTYLPMSVGLFLGGIGFCFYGVLPTVLDFLLGFNTRIGLTAQIRISEWISFAVMLPLMFGISFQLPLAMLFLTKINVFTVEHYIAQWKMAVLAIAVISMLLTPTPDPMTMLLMMAPLLVLYAMGILLCHWTLPKTTVEAAT